MATHKLSDEQAPATHHPAGGSAGMPNDVDVAPDWDAWSEEVGLKILPIVEDLAKAMGSFNSAMVCTADGLNLCTLGIDEGATRRLSALTSSMHSLADAVSQAVHDDEHRRLDRLTLTNGSATTVVLAIPNSVVGQLLLWVTADNEILGPLLMRSQQAAAAIEATLKRPA